MTDSPKTRIGFAGAGNIFDAYGAGLARFRERVEVRRVADVDLARAEQRATKYDIPAWGPLEDLLADPKVDVVINITPPTTHAEVTVAAARTGKHVFTEKPLATSTAAAAAMLETVASTGQRFGSAPDTFLGQAGQTARAAIDRGDIGEVVGFTAFSTHTRPELWHPNPTFLFQPGGGPVFDMGPYFIAGLVNLLGPVAQVAGKTRIGAKTRKVTAPNRLVDVIDVTVPTHANAVLTFASGAVGTIVMSSDIWDHRLPNIEIYGTFGTLAVPHPNWYVGEVTIRLHGDQEWRVVEPVNPMLPGDDSRSPMLRGVGVMDLVDSLAGAPQRTSAAFAYHTLEVLEAVQVSSDTSSVVTLRSTCDRPAPLAKEQIAGWKAGTTG
jgi:predicted dehydrogenase